MLHGDQPPWFTRIDGFLVYEILSFRNSIVLANWVELVTFLCYQLSKEVMFPNSVYINYGQGLEDHQ